MGIFIPFDNTPLIQQIDVDSESKPIIAGTSVSVKDILENLAAGMEMMAVIEACLTKTKVISQQYLLFIHQVPGCASYYYS